MYPGSSGLEVVFNIGQWLANDAKISHGVYSMILHYSIHRLTLQGYIFWMVVVGSMCVQVCKVVDGVGM